MRISADCGALCATPGRQFGTYTFTANMMSALSLYDHENQYIGYTFCDVPGESSPNLTYKKLPKKMWMTYHVTAHELMEPADIFLALSQSLPPVSRARNFSFLHGLSFVHYPHLYPDSAPTMKKQLDQAMSRSECIFVSSIRIKEQLAQLYKSDRVHVLPYGVPMDMLAVEGEAVRERAPYFLFVGMDHPIKNIDHLIEVFKTFTSQPGNEHYKLYLVGNHDPGRMRDPAIRICDNMSRAELRLLYAEATGYLTMSLYESLHFPVLEALSLGCPVVGTAASVIPELQHYVRMAASDEEYIAKMNELTRGDHTPIVDRHKLYEDFSWAAAVNQVRSFYRR